MFSVIENIWMSKKDQPQVLANLFGNKLLNWVFSLIFEQGTFENVIRLVDFVWYLLILIDLDSSGLILVNLVDHGESLFTYVALWWSWLIWAKLPPSPGTHEKQKFNGRTSVTNV